MRILITGTTGESMPPPYGGIPKVSLLYAREWKKMGHDVAITFTYQPVAADDLGAGVRYFFQYGAKPTRISKFLFLARHKTRHPLLYLSRLSAYWKISRRVDAELLLYSAYGVWLDGVISQFAPDIILSEAALIQGFMAGESAKVRRIPLIFDTYAEVRDENMGVNAYLKPRARRRYWERLLGLSELVIGMANCSDGPLRYLPKEKVKVFYDTCDFSRSRECAKESKNKCRETLSLPQDAFLVGAVGAFSPRKGHDHLIRAAGMLAREGRSVFVALCGAGDPSDWKHIAKDEGISDKVFFFQGLSEVDLVRLYRSCDIYANLSNSTRSCGLDLALLEAMAAERPIVVYDTGALASAVSQGRNGYVLPADDVAGVARILKLFSELPVDEQTRMGKESAEVASKCDIRETARIKLSWLAEVLTAYHV